MVTLLGWAQVVKGAIYFVAPAFGLRQLQRVTVERHRMFWAAGVGLIALAFWIGRPLV